MMIHRLTERNRVRRGGFAPFICAAAASAAAVLLAACGGGGSSGAPPAVVAAAPSSTSSPVRPTAAPSPSPAHPPTAVPATAAPATTATPTGTPARTPSPAPILSPTTPPTPGPSTSPVAASAADSIVDMIGVDTHFAYVDTAYKYLTPANPAPNGNSILSLLAALGVRHLRDGDGRMTTNSFICTAFQAAAAAGTDADIVVLVNDTAPAVAAISPCVGSGLRAIEGPNELDLSGDTHFAADDVSVMTALAGARGTLFPGSVALFAPSLAAGCGSYQAEAAVNADAIAGVVDDNNAHIYFGGYQPENSGTGGVQCGIGNYGAESTFLQQARIPAPAKPIVVTETGYADDCCGFNDSGYVAPAIKTKYLLRTLLEHYTSGVKYAYIYELASESQSFGLTDELLNPKPAFTALANFIAVLKDPGGGATSGTLRLSLSPSLAGANHVLFEKQDGSFWLVLWQPAQSWNPIANAPLGVAPANGTIAFAAPPAAVNLYTFNPADGTVTVAPLVSNDVVSLSVSDTPEILQIGTTANAPVLTTSRRRR